LSLFQCVSLIAISFLIFSICDFDVISLFHLSIGDFGIHFSFSFSPMLILIVIQFSFWSIAGFDFRFLVVILCFAIVTQNFRCYLFHWCFWPCFYCSDSTLLIWIVISVFDLLHWWSWPVLSFHPLHRWFGMTFIC
jgi:hypothetical protein